jgi:hypothetical protein
MHDAPLSVIHLFLFISSFPGSVVPSYGHRPRTGALARIPRLVCLLLYQRQCRHGASNTRSFLNPLRGIDGFVFVFFPPNQMHRQIGNAVPWPVAAAIGRELREARLKKWRRDRQEAMAVD